MARILSVSAGASAITDPALGMVYASYGVGKRICELPWTWCMLHTERVCELPPPGSWWLSFELCSQDLSADQMSCCGQAASYPKGHALLELQPIRHGPRLFCKLLVCPYGDLQPHF